MKLRNVLVGASILIACLAAFAGYVILYTGYGPLEDHGGIDSALPVANSQALFSYHRFHYRPASGWRAFPDGGNPRYATDSFVLGLVDSTGKTTILVNAPNTEWCHGQGSFHLIHVVENVALLSQGGQKRDNTYETRYFLLDLTTGKLGPVGRLSGPVYLLDAAGTLLNVASGNELWIRHSNDSRIRIGAATQFMGINNGEVYWWEQQGRAIKIYSPTTGQTRQGDPRVDVPAPTAIPSIPISSDKRSLQIGTQWLQLRP
jgi:hypothetical protein